MKVYIGLVLTATLLPLLARAETLIRIDFQKTGWSMSTGSSAPAQHMIEVAWGDQSKSVTDAVPPTNASVTTK